MVESKKKVYKVYEVHQFKAFFSQILKFCIPLFHDNKYSSLDGGTNRSDNWLDLPNPAAGD